MTIDELNAIAKALRIGVDEFINFEEDEDEPSEDDNPFLRKIKTKSGIFCVHCARISSY